MGAIQMFGQQRPQRGKGCRVPSPCIEAPARLFSPHRTMPESGSGRMTTSTIALANNPAPFRPIYMDYGLPVACMGKSDGMFFNPGCVIGPILQKKG